MRTCSTFLCVLEYSGDHSRCVRCYRRLSWPWRYWDPSRQMRRRRPERTGHVVSCSVSDPYSMDPDTDPLIWTNPDQKHWSRVHTIIYSGSETCLAYHIASDSDSTPKIRFLTQNLANYEIIQIVIVRKRAAAFIWKLYAIKDEFDHFG